MDKNNVTNNIIDTSSSIESSSLKSIDEYFKSIEKNIVDNTNPQEIINK